MPLLDRSWIACLLIPIAALLARADEPKADSTLIAGVTPQRWSATIYPGPKGNFVFNAATIFWAQGLGSPPGHTLPWTHWTRPHGPDDRVQKITHNLLRRAIKGPR